LAFIAFTAIAIGAILISASLMSDPAWRPAASVLLAISVAGAVAYLLLGAALKHHHPPIGLYERIFLGLELLWIAVAAISIARQTPALSQNEPITRLSFPGMVARRRGARDRGGPPSSTSRSGLSGSGQLAAARLASVAVMTRNHAQAFADLHKRGEPLLLPNAWDVASAVAIAGAGAKAIATTSAGVAWSLGVPDGAGLGAKRAAAVTARIVAALDLPVSADIEAGYEDVAATVTAVLQAGAVGVNIEDRRNGAGLYESAEQADRLAAARTAADGVPFWINARTDVFLGGSGRIDDALDRSAAYAAAGADSLFVPGLVDPAGIAELATGPLPVAVMVWPGAPPVAELTAAGAVRISLGSAIAQAAYAVAVRAATELLTRGTYDSVADGIAYNTMNDAVTATPGLPS